MVTHTAYLRMRVHNTMTRIPLVMTCMSALWVGCLSQCPVNFYSETVTPLNLRALALSPGRAQLASLATRGTTPIGNAVYQSTAGPNGNGAVTFARAQSEYLDAGSHVFNINTNGGFTAVMLVRFTSPSALNERIFDFGRGEDDLNMLIWRNTFDGKFHFAIITGTNWCLVTSDANLFQHNVWARFVATYSKAAETITLRINGVAISAACTIAGDRTTTKSYLGRSNWATDPYLQGSIAGFYAVDALLDSTQISELEGKMSRGEDPLLTCAACPTNMVSVAGSTSISMCARPDCGVGNYDDNITCQQCPSGTYNPNSNGICQACPSEYTSLPGSIALSSCRKLLPFESVCMSSAQSVMAVNLCAAIAAGNNIHTHIAAALGTTQLVRYTFSNSWGCNAQATVPAAQRISGAAPNQVLACPQIPGAVYVKADAPCQFACDENHTRTGETCTRVCGNVTAAACGPRHFASATCNHAGYTLYECEPCAYAAGQQALPWSALNSATCPSTPCAAGTLGANGVCAPCAMNTFSAAGSATCALCARGTFSSTGSSVCSTCFEDTFVIDVSNYGGANVLATRGVPVVLEWPSGHPALITTSTAVTWNSLVEFAAPLFPVVVDTTLYRTTFTVPEDYSGDLFYICQWHSIMGVNSISIKPAAPCAEGAVAAHSVAAVDAYFARTAAAGHNVSQHNILYDFCHARGACLPCLPGEHEQAGACVACDYAHYQPNFQMPHCFECTSGHNTTTRGSVSAADCLCQPGFE